MVPGYGSEPFEGPWAGPSAFGDHIIRLCPGVIDPSRIITILYHWARIIIPLHSSFPPPPLHLHPSLLPPLSSSIHPLLLLPSSAFHFRTRGCFVKTMGLFPLTQMDEQEMNQLLLDHGLAGLPIRQQQQQVICPSWSEDDGVTLSDFYVFCCSPLS